jgi:hypothetical protein
MEEERITNLHFDVNKAIRPDVIERIWQGIKRELASDGYPVESIVMPQITGWTLDMNNLRKAWEKTSSTPALMNMSLVEYGEESEKWAAFTFPSVAQTSADQKWMVLLWEGKRPIRRPLRHELLHIWESLLGLKWGTLTGKYQPAD